MEKGALTSLLIKQGFSKKEIDDYFKEKKQKELERKKKKALAKKKPKPRFFSGYNTVTR